VRRADNLTTFMCRLSWNLGASSSWNPLGLSRPVMGLLYLYLLLGCDENYYRLINLRKEMVMGYFETQLYSTLAQSRRLILQLRYQMHTSWTQTRCTRWEKRNREFRKTSCVCYYHSSNPVQDNASFTDAFKQEMDIPRVAQAATFLATCLSGSEQFQFRS